MDASRPAWRPGRLPAGLLGTLALVLAVEGFVSRHALDVLDLDDWQYRLAGRDTGRNARGRDLLCLGDSLVKVSVLPRVLGARSGLNAYNLAVCGAQAPTSYAILRRALAGGSRPSAVLVDFFPPLLAYRPRISEQRLPHLIGYGEAVELALRARDPAFLGVLVARKSLPSLRSRTALRAWAVSVVAGKLSHWRTKMPGILRHWVETDGTLLMSANEPGRNPVVDAATHQRYNYPPGWSPDRVNGDYLRRFLELAESYGVTVYWLIPPVHPAVQAAKERAGFDAHYLALVRKCQRRFANLVVIDGRHAGYDPAVFMDADHLAMEGAVGFSEDLGDLLRAIRRTPPPDRWATLPRYRPRLLASGIESAFGTRAAASVMR